MTSSASEAVKVMVRCRPMNNLEVENKSSLCVQIDSNSNQVKLITPNEGVQKLFSFDKVFDPATPQSNVYEESAFQLVESVVEGYNGTIFAYGQTGCGKTFTMTGISDDEKLKGIVPRTFSHIIDVIETNKGKNFLLRCSYLEIYNEEIHDLLGNNVRQKYEVRESPEKGFFVEDLSLKIVKSIAELENLLQIGTDNRSKGETKMNKESSRSHSIFSIYLETSERVDDNNSRITAGKLNLVDLAGSERQSKTQATGTALKEATKINLSLAALGNVISALVDGNGKSSHIPYRDSKLTKLLQDSLGGNTKTVMIACISPASYNYDEILGTLRYASRAKNIQNKPKVNEDPKDALLKSYADEIQRLKALLNQQGGININMPQNIKEGSALKKIERGFDEHRNLDADKENFEKELKNKNELLDNEKKEKERLGNLITELQEQLFVNQYKLPEKELKEYELLKKKMKKQKKKEERLLQEKKNKEQEVQQAEKKYQNISEELDELKKKNKELNENLKNSLFEIRDLQKEHEGEKEDYLESIRTLEQENTFLKQENKFLTHIIQTLLKPKEIEKIKAQSWDDDLNEYIIKPFIVKDKTIKFPKLSLKKVNDIIENDRNQREVAFPDKTEPGHHHAKSQNSMNSEDDKERVSYKKEKKKNNENGNLNSNEVYFVYHQTNSQTQIKPGNYSQKNIDYGYEQNSVLLPVRNKNNVPLEPLNHRNFHIEMTEATIDLKDNRAVSKKNHHLTPLAAGTKLYGSESKNKD